MGISFCHSHQNNLKKEAFNYTPGSTQSTELWDIGLLCTQLNVDFGSVINQTIGSFKGFLAEVFTAQELVASEFIGEMISWHERNSELEFLLTHNGSVIPLEVKSGNQTQAKSLRTYKQKYSPDCSIKLSARNLRYEENGHINAPVYLAGYLGKIIAHAEYSFE